MDQNPRAGPRFSVVQSQPPAAAAAQTTAAVVTPATNTNYVLTSNSLRPVTNYTLVASPQAPVSQQYVVQSKARTAGPQYVNTGHGVRHVLGPGAGGQSSNVAYVLPSGAHIVRMNNVLTTTVAGDQRPNMQYILAPSSQPSKTNMAAVVENSPGPSGAASSRTLGAQTSTTPIIQGSAINLPKLNTLNAGYYGQVRANDPTKIFRPKLNDQTAGTNFILTSNDWSRTKNVPITNLQKFNPNYMQIPFIQKTGGAVLAGNALKTNVDIQQQSMRSVILPSNYNKNSDSKLVLSSVNLPTQVDQSNDKPNSPTVIQQLNTNFMQIPVPQKSATIINCTNPQPNIQNNILMQQHPSIRPLILPPAYRTSMVSTPRRNLDYRLVLKPMLRNLGPSRFISQCNPTPLKNASPALSNTVPSIRPSVCRMQSEIIANSKIVPIPRSGRKSHLVISKKSVQICIDEINKSVTDNELTLIVTEPAIALVTTEVTYRLFYLLRECKKVLVRSRSNVLTEDIMKQICAEYFSPFYGNKLWPLFCLKPNDNDESNNEDRVWMRKHNNVNLVGWLKHPKFRNPSYIKKRVNKNAKNDEFPLTELMDISEILYECSEPIKTSGKTPEPETQTLEELLQNDQVPLADLSSLNTDSDLNQILQSFMDISE